VKEYVAVHSTPAAAAGGVRGKGKGAKKKGVTLALDVFNEMQVGSGVCVWGGGEEGVGMICDAGLPELNRCAD
jgi:hypothetical protein